MNTNNVIILARKHLDNNSRSEGANKSARLCLADAIKLSVDGRLDDAKARAIKSLAYSVGVFHADYKRAAK